MSESKNKTKIFEKKQIRTAWDENAEKWWFSIVDVVRILTDPRQGCGGGAGTAEAIAKPIAA